MFAPSPQTIPPANPSRRRAIAARSRSSVRVPLLLLLLLYIALWRTSPAYGLEVTYGDTTPRGCRLTEPAVILSGAIVEGDYERITRWFLANPSLFLRSNLGILLDSPGGSIPEAIRIAGLFERILAQVWVPPFCVNRPHDDHERTPICGSACFALIVGSSVRIVSPENVAIHRPYFSPSEYGSLDAISARQAYDSMINTFKGWLARRHVPSNLIEAMLRNSSQESYRLTRSDMEQLGESALWFEEYAIAKCQYEKGAVKRWLDARARGASLEAERLEQSLARQGACIENLVLQHRRDLLAPKGGLSQPAEDLPHTR